MTSLTTLSDVLSAMQRVGEIKREIEVLHFVQARHPKYNVEELKRLEKELNELLGRGFTACNMSVNL